MSATNETEGLANRNSIRLTLGKSVRWVNDELGWEVGRVVLVDGKHLIDGYFGGMRTHYLVQGYHGGLFFVKDTILEDAPDRSTYEDKDGNPLPTVTKRGGTEELYWPKETDKPIKLANWPLLDSLISENKAAAERNPLADPRTPPNTLSYLYSKLHKEARQAHKDFVDETCKATEPAATLDCRKGNTIQFDEELSYKM